MRAIRGRAIGMVFQEPMTSLNPVLAVGAQIAEAAAVHGAGRAAARARAIEMLRLVEIADPERRADAYPHQLSGGMRQRVMLAMALACEPRVLIADEPTTALDVTIQAQVLDLLAALQRRLGMAVLLVTHDLGVVAERADIAIMYAGRIVRAARRPPCSRRRCIPTRAACSPRGRRPAARTARGDPAPSPSAALPSGCRFHRCGDDRRARAPIRRCAPSPAAGVWRIRVEPQDAGATLTDDAAPLPASASCARTFRSAAGCGAAERRAPSPTCRSPSPPARRSASSANPAAARPRWDAWFSAHRPTAGRIEFDGDDLLARSAALPAPARDAVGVPGSVRRARSAPASATSSVKGSRSTASPRAASGARVAALLARVGLDEAADHVRISSVAGSASGSASRPGARAAADRRRRAGVRARRVGPGRSSTLPIYRPRSASPISSLRTTCGLWNTSRAALPSCISAASSNWRTPPRSTPPRAIRTRARCCRRPHHRCGAATRPHRALGRATEPAGATRRLPVHPRCAYAEARCRTDRPALLGTATHQVACHVFPV
jgi:ABC-type nitrate/sulfonate/bicarbonate transport system ATPase subunit